MVAAFLQSWSGTAIRHIPSGSPFDVLDTRFAGLAADNRWNEAGEPTFYVAGDLGVALAEYARHLREDVGVTGAPPVYERAALDAAIRLFLANHNADPQRFVWVTSADDIIDSIARFGTTNFWGRTLETLELLEREPKSHHDQDAHERKRVAPVSLSIRAAVHRCAQDSQPQMHCRR